MLQSSHKGMQQGMKQDSPSVVVFGCSLEILQQVPNLRLLYTKMTRHLIHKVTAATLPRPKACVQKKAIMSAEHATKDALDRQLKNTSSQSHTLQPVSRELFCIVCFMGKCILVTSSRQSCAYYLADSASLLLVLRHVPSYRQNNDRLSQAFDQAGQG